MRLKVHYSSGKDTWETPDELFKALDAEFQFTLDVAADASNHKTARWLGPGGDAEDALAEDVLWEGRCWMNPPYSRGAQRKFIEKAVEEVRAGHAEIVVALLPARTDTKAFHEFIWETERSFPRPWVQQVRFLKGRVKFVGAENGAPFPSMVVVFRRPDYGWDEE